MAANSWVMNAATVGLGFGGFYALREYMRGGQCRSDVRMDGKTVVITGCNTGIGKETALDLAGRGARVVMACRDMDRASAAADDIRQRLDNADLVLYKCDLSSLRSVRDCADEINTKEGRVDVLINNAGLAFQPYSRTEDGLEIVIATNHFGHFLFTNLLLEKLKDCAPSRVVNVSSNGHTRGKLDLNDINWEQRKYSMAGAYQDSKLANNLFTRELARRLEGTGVTTYALHPGVVFTDIWRNINNWIGPFRYLLYFPALLLMKNCKDGAQTTIECAVAPSLASESGKYYCDCVEVAPAPQATDDDAAKKLWQLSEKAVGL